MTKTSISLQALRRKIYMKAKADKSWRFWGLYTHVCKLETLQEAYRLTKRNNGAPGIDGVTFEAIEAAGAEAFLAQLQTELQTHTYKPLGHKERAIPKGDGKSRILKIPAIRDRVVQGAVKLILEPIFESDFQPGSYGYRPKRTAHAALECVTQAIVKRQLTRVIDVDLKSYFDTIRHDILLNKIALRVHDANMMRLLKRIFKASGKRGVPQGGPLSPLVSNIYLNEVDKMLERAKEVTGRNGYQHIEYVRWADDLMILIDGHHSCDDLVHKVYKRLTQELAKLDVTINQEKTRQVNLVKGECFSFLGFDFRRKKTHKGKWSVTKTPKMAARTKLLRSIKEVFRRYRSQATWRIMELINPKLRGWVNYFRIGNASRCFNYIKKWVERKVRRHLMRARKRKGGGWCRWSTQWLYESLGLYADYSIRYYYPQQKVLPAR